MSIPGIDKLIDRIRELEEQYMNLDMQKLEVTAERNRYKAERDALKDEVEFTIGTLRDIQSIDSEKYYMVDAAINHFQDALNKIKEEVICNTQKS